MNHPTHDDHSHQHDAQCAHTAIAHDGHVDEHVIGVTAANPADCTGSHTCGGHESAHLHAPNCGHEAVPHADHVDYLVEGHLHNVHAGHCDDHGKLSVA